MSSQYFSQTYREAKARILSFGSKHSRLARSWSRPFGEADGEALTMDALLFRGDQDPDFDSRLVVLSSALHGIEGFTGSAVQLGVLDYVLDRSPNFDLLIVHAINPFGFHFRRRVNADNIDLNRNGTRPEDSRENPGYERYKELFNPGRPITTRPWQQRWIMTQLMARALINKAAIKDAFLNGQYSDPTGPFYGGAELAGEIRAVGDILAELAPDYDAIAHLDIHTGYGVRGRAHVLCYSETMRATWRRLGLGPEEETAGVDYRMNGNLLAWLESRLREVKPSLLYRSMLVEFGTIGVDLSSQLESMRIAISDSSEGPKGQASPDVMELYNPSCPRWRHDVVQQGLTLTRRVGEAFARRSNSERSQAPSL